METEGTPLDAIREARSAAAARVAGPWWFHPVLGLAAGLFTVAFAFENWAVRIPVMVLFGGTVVAMAFWRARRRGVWTAHVPGSRADRWSSVIAGICFVGVIAAATVARFTDLVWVVALIGLGVAVLVAALGPRYDAAQRAQVRGAA